MNELEKISPKDYYIVASGRAGRKLMWTLHRLVKIANESGNLQAATRWMNGKTAYAMSIRNDTGKRLVTMMTEAKFIELGNRIDTELYKINGPTLLLVAATMLNLETHFEAEIKAAKEVIGL